MSTNAELLEHAYIPTEEDNRRFAKLGEAIAEVIQVEMQLPSFMRMAIEHQKEHPEKTPMQCLGAVREPYLRMQHEVVSGIAKRACSKDCK